MGDVRVYTSVARKSSVNNMATSMKVKATYE